MANQLEKDKLALGRIIGISLDQKFELTDRLAYRPLSELTPETATEEAFHSRADLASVEAGVQAAASTVRAEKAQRLPVVSVSADYGAAGTNPGNFNQVYTVSGNISVPIYTGGRIRADIGQAEADLARRQGSRLSTRPTTLLPLGRQQSQAGRGGIPPIGLGVKKPVLYLVPVGTTLPAPSRS